MTAGVASALSVTAVTAGSVRRPNVVIILADDQRFDMMGCSGHPFAMTPSIDRLAKEGVYFEQATVNTPLCGPSRASLFTGCYAHKHLLRHNGTGVDKPVPMPVPCFPALMRDAGYRTALFGKFHGGDAEYTDPGFDTFEYCLEGGKYRNVKFSLNGQAKVMSGHVDEVISERAVSWIGKQCSAERPFLAILSHVAPHMPITGNVPAKYSEMYQDFKPWRRAGALYPEKNPVSGWNRQGREWFASMHENNEIPAWTCPPPWTDEQIRDRMRLSQVLDASVRQVYETLKKAGELDNTIFIYHSDNGYYLGEHGLSEKYYPFEEGLRVPLIIRYPKKIRPGLRSPALAQTIDIAPTVFEWCGFPIPESFDGSTLSQAIADPVGFREYSYHEFFHHEGENPPFVWQAIRNADCLYARFAKPENDEEFYDLHTDPWQLRNLATEAEKEYRIFEIRKQFEHVTAAAGASPIKLAEEK
jgi:N-acetylglucosamine-6-sulfatase